MSLTSLSLQSENIEINADYLNALDLIEKGAPYIFITGKAGTGKSTFLQYCRTQIKRNLVVLAPTGVAAVNVKGQTIHSFFGFKPDITLKAIASIPVRQDMKKVYKQLRTLIIDEVSMVRADLIDCIDAFLKLYGLDAKKPFGGVQLILMGDLNQLPPVVLSSEKAIFRSLYASPYFFDAHVFKSLTIEIVEFEKNYRQKDKDEFLELLDAIRNNRINPGHIDTLNRRLNPHFQPKDSESYVYLTTTNRIADQINDERLKALKEDPFTYDGKIKGTFTAQTLPTHEVLELKIGAQVMLLNNDLEGRWINGSIGKVKDIFNAGFNAIAVLVELVDGTEVEVEPYTWEIFEFFYNTKKDSIDSRSKGSFQQFPMKLAWAMTIHKSQGKTFDRVIIDVGSGAFCHGQIYVALSRCTSLEGIVLKNRIASRDIQMDSRIYRFLRGDQ